FTSEGYAAGYYGYIWADVLAADAYEAFVETGNSYDPAVALKLYKYIYSIGGSVDPAQAYRNYRGRDPKIEALLRARGFPVK
ncbi:MAG: hypothetical protein KDD38_09290, partial [Bdellovibrionales bacterium]|nr:hypothetical protein [Bdellovibrionales bacterium]